MIMTDDDILFFVVFGSELIAGTLLAYSKVDGNISGIAVLTSLIYFAFFFGNMSNTYSKKRLAKLLQQPL